MSTTVALARPPEARTNDPEISPLPPPTSRMRGRSLPVSSLARWNARASSQALTRSVALARPSASAEANE
jgi:hypothetical protein